MLNPSLFVEETTRVRCLKDAQRFVKEKYPECDAPVQGAISKLL
jgi:hypothetical protein